MPSITTILVPREDIESDDAWVVVDSLSVFAKAAVKAGYSLDDLPEEIRWNSEVTNALTQINRNGPSLYFYNVLAEHDGLERWKKIVDATRAGLAALGNVPQASAYDDLISIYENNRASIVNGRRADTPFKLAKDFDLLCHFMPSGKAEDEFMGERVRWVRSLSIIRPIARTSYDQELAILLSA